METIKTEKIKETKNQFFEKQTKLINLQPKPSRKKRAQINKIRNEREVTTNMKTHGTTTTSHIPTNWTTRKFLDACRLPRLNGGRDRKSKQTNY